MPLGIYVSRCDGRIDAAVDLDALVDEASARGDVARVFDDLFDPGVASRIAQDVVDSGLDAVVLAGNSAEHYQKSVSAHHLTDRIVEAGVNPNRIVPANLLEQVALVHGNDREGATRKALGELKVAILRATMSSAEEGVVSEPLRSVVILGVTTEAAVAAQRLLRLGYSVVLVDRKSAEERVTGVATMKATSSFVLDHPRAQVLDSAHLIDADGWLGDYRLVFESPLGKSTFRAGGILLARPDNIDWVGELRQHFRVDLDDDGFARSIHPQTHPAETIDPGIMVVPLRREDALERDKVAAADAAAMALVLKLSQPVVTRYREISSVDESLCGGCASCVRTCAFGACTIGPDGLSVVDERRCRACGKCVVGCPVGARDIVNSPHDYLLEAVRELAKTEVAEGQKVLGFLCGGCGYPAADNASETEGGYPASFLPVRIPCGGRLDTLYVLEAFKQGFDGVSVYRCREGHCHNLLGNLDMDRRMNLLRTVLRSRNIDDSRLRIVDISPSEGSHFIDSVNQVFANLDSLSSKTGGAQ